MFKKITTLLVTLALVTSIQAQSALFEAKDLIGRWTSIQPENYGQFFATREFLLTERAWTILFKATTDASGKTPLWTLRVEGTYQLGQAHPNVPGARYADFGGDAKYITAYTPDMLAVFAQGRPWKVGVEYDFSATGAGFFPSVKDGPKELDLVKLEGDTLYLGDRSVDLNKVRAQKLSAYPLIRKR